MNEIDELTREKAKQFITRLMSNPALQGMAPLKKEQQIRYFLKVNESQLLPTLSSPAFFPGKTPGEIYKILESALRGMTGELLNPRIRQFFSSGLRPAALVSAVGDPGLDVTRLRETLWKLFTLILDSKEGREALVPALTLIDSPIFDRYVPQIIQRQKYISFEIRMVQRFKEVQENIIDYLKLIVLLKPIVYTFLSNTGELVNGCISVPYCNVIANQLSRKYPSLPEPILKGIIQANVSFLDERNLPATSRLAGIFTQRAMHWNPAQKIDRGAETSDKSWFSITRKNYRYYGYDLDMLLELYNIASELGW